MAGFVDASLDHSEVSRRLKHLRESMFLSQKEFSEKAELSITLVSLMEKGEKRVSEKTINKICRAFGVNKEWLKSGIGSMYEDKMDDLKETLRKKYNLSKLQMSLLEDWLSLPEDQQIMVNRILKIVNSGGENLTVKVEDSED